MSGAGEVLVTIPERRLRSLEEDVVRAQAEADRASATAASAQAELAEMRALVQGLRELFQRRIDGALQAAGEELEEAEPVAAGFGAYRRRVLASEGRRD